MMELKAVHDGIECQNFYQYFGEKTFKFSLSCWPYIYKIAWDYNNYIINMSQDTKVVYSMPASPLKQRGGGGDVARPAPILRIKG